MSMIPDPEAVSTLVVALQHMASHSRVDRTASRLMLSAVAMLAAFDSYRGMVDKRHRAIYRALGHTLREYNEAAHKRDSEYEVMIDNALVVNALRRNEPIGWVQGQLRPTIKEGIVLIERALEDQPPP